MDLHVRCSNKSWICSALICKVSARISSIPGIKSRSILFDMTKLSKTSGNPFSAKVAEDVPMGNSGRPSLQAATLNKVSKLPDDPMSVWQGVKGLPKLGQHVIHVVPNAPVVLFGHRILGGKPLHQSGHPKGVGCRKMHCILF
jgi:hypothetical protein